MKKGFLWSVAALVACSTTTEKKDTVKEAPVQQETATPDEEINLEQYDNKFVYEDGKTRHLLGVNYKSPREIEFETGFYKKDGTCTGVFKGIAVNANAGGDPEIDEDEKGDAYASDEFIYEANSCVIQIRIAQESKDKAVIFTSGCNKACYPEESGVLNAEK